jgi:hypothetical protein
MSYKITRTKTIAEEGIYYKMNRVILKRGNKFILRNTWTGKEEIISKKEANRLIKEWRLL